MTPLIWHDSAGNTRRRLMAEGYFQKFPNLSQGGGDHQERLSDALTNLLHLAAFRGLDPDEEIRPCLERAWDHFVVEAKGEE